MIFIELNLSFHLLLRLVEALGYVDTEEQPGDRWFGSTTVRPSMSAHVVDPVNGCNSPTNALSKCGTCRILRGVDRDRAGRRQNPRAVDVVCYPCDSAVHDVEVDHRLRNPSVRGLAQDDDHLLAVHFAHRPAQGHRPALVDAKVR